MKGRAEEGWVFPSTFSPVLGEGMGVYPISLSNPGKMEEGSHLLQTVSHELTGNHTQDKTI